MKSAASVTPEEREKVHKLCAFPWGVSAIPDEVKRMLAEDVDDDPSSAEESEELDFSCSSSSAAASNPNDPNNPQATKAVSSSVAEEVLPVSFASASFAGKEAEGKNDAGAATQPGFFDRYFGGGHGAPVAKAKKGDTPSVAPAKKKGRNWSGTRRTCSTLLAQAHRQYRRRGKLPRAAESGKQRKPVTGLIAVGKGTRYAFSDSIYRIKV